MLLKMEMGRTYENGNQQQRRRYGISWKTPLAILGVYGLVSAAASYFSSEGLAESSQNSIATDNIDSQERKIRQTSSQLVPLEAVGTVQGSLILRAGEGEKE